MKKRRAYVKRSGQAAMEFLLSYGWAIMVVIVVISALAYLGVLNPQRFIPERCDISAGLSCDVLVITYPTLESIITITNRLGATIDITLISIKSDAKGGDGIPLVDCHSDDNDDGLPKIVRGGETYTHHFDPLPGSNNCDYSVLSLKPGMKVKGTIAVNYKNLETGVAKSEVGQFVATFTPLIPFPP